MRIRAIAGLGEQGRHDHGQIDRFRLGQVAVAGGRKVMDQIALLLPIPPAEIFHLHTERFESGLGLIDLNLKSAVGEQEGGWMIKEDAHGI